MPTISEVAKKSGVSPTTVSHVINGTRFVSEETRRRVEQAIDELGYRPNALARSLRRGDTNTIGVIVPDSANQFFAEVGHSIEMSAFRAGYSVILCNTENDFEKETRYVDVLIKKQVDGVIFVATGDSSASIKVLMDMKMPVVVLDRDFPDIEANVVLTDHRQGGYEATKHLIALGHKRIGCIAGPSNVNPSIRRVNGYKQALEEAGLVVDPELIVSGDFHPQSGWKNAHDLLSKTPPPTAIFACNDMMALGVLRAADELRRHVPSDLAVVGYDDIQLASYSIPPLTTVKQSKREMGQAAIDCLINCMSEKQASPCRTTLPVSLVVRGSCGGDSVD